MCVCVCVRMLGLGLGLELGFRLGSGSRLRSGLGVRMCLQWRAAVRRSDVRRNGKLGLTPPPPLLSLAPLAPQVLGLIGHRGSNLALGGLFGDA